MTGGEIVAETAAELEVDGVQKDFPKEDDAEGNRY